MLVPYLMTARRSQLCAIACLAAGTLFLQGCAEIATQSSAPPTPGRVCQVKPGESLGQIAMAYSTTPEAIARYNDTARWQLPPGTALNIPPENPLNSVGASIAGNMPDFSKLGEGLGGSQNANVCPRPSQSCPVSAVPLSAAPIAAPPAPVQTMPPVGQVCPRPSACPVSQHMIWPLKGRVAKGFDAGHTGLDIQAAEGSSIRAARDGEVFYAGDQGSGYGNMVIIKHGSELATVYAHNRRNLVQKGQTVRQGQIVAEVGRTGNAASPTCYFEVRDNAKPVDPSALLQ